MMGRVGAVLALIALAWVGTASPLWAQNATTVVGIIVTPPSNFNRPGNTTTYASGQLVANSTVAGSVAPLQWAVGRAGTNQSSVFVRRARLIKSTGVLTSASFRLHLYGIAPTNANGDGGNWSTNRSLYYGSIDITVNKAFTDGSEGIGVPNEGSEISIQLPANQTIIYGEIEARGAYPPGSAENFAVELETWQN